MSAIKLSILNRDFLHKVSIGNRSIKQAIQVSIQLDNKETRK